MHPLFFQHARRGIPTAARRAFAASSSRVTPPDEVVRLRRQHLAPSLRTFEAYDEPMVLARGDGCHLWDADGRRYVDLLGQNLCVSVGYNHPEIIDAAVEQLRTLSHCTTMYYHKQPARYAEELLRTLPPHPSGQDWVVHFVNDGSEAVDLAVQMARVFTGRHEVVALHKAYHGLQGLAAGLTAIGKSTQSAYSATYGSGIAHVRANDVSQLRDHFEFATGGRVAAMIAEPLQGYGGIHPLADGYLAAAFDEVRARGGVCIADEVQTGFGRCGDAFWGFDLPHNRAIPDMLTIAKGMGNGVAAIGAVVCRRDIAEAFTQKMFFNTYACNPVACAVGRAVLRVIEEEALMENCRARGAQFSVGLRELCARFPGTYRAVRGTGLFQGLEIAGAGAAEGENKTAGGADEDGSQERAIALHRSLRALGVIAGRGSAAGNVFRVQPPMCITEAEVTHVLTALEQLALEEEE